VSVLIIFSVLKDETRAVKFFPLISVMLEFVVTFELERPYLAK